MPATRCIDKYIRLRYRYRTADCRVGRRKVGVAGSIICVCHALPNRRAESRVSSEERRTPWIRLSGVEASRERPALRNSGFDQGAVRRLLNEFNERTRSCHFMRRKIGRCSLSPSFFLSVVDARRRKLTDRRE